MRSQHQEKGNSTSMSPHNKIEQANQTSTIPASYILQLQKSIGNRAVAQLMKSGMLTTQSGGGNLYRKETQVLPNKSTSLRAIQLNRNSKSVIQATWEPTDKENISRWDALIDGVQWFSDEQGSMFYQIVEANDNIETYRIYEGPKHSYSAEEWDRIELSLTTPMVQMNQVVNTGAAIDAIQKTEIEKSMITILDSSRGKRVILFDAAGSPTKSKMNAKYMVDLDMSKQEIGNYEKVGTMGIRAPQVLGYAGGSPIVEFIANHLVIGGGGSLDLVGNIKRQLGLDKLTKKKFDTAKWSRTLSEIKLLISLNYNNGDIQFMIENSTGALYVMDLEDKYPPIFGSAPSKALLAAEEFLTIIIANKGV